MSEGVSQIRRRRRIKYDTDDTWDDSNDLHEIKSTQLIEYCTSTFKPVSPDTQIDPDIIWGKF